MSSTQEAANAHAIITSRAADIANSMVPQYRELLKSQGLNENIIRRIAQFVGVGNYFRPKPRSAGNENFGLVIDYNFEGISNPEERKTLRQTFKKIGSDSIKQAVSENVQVIRIAVIADAYKEENYFADFKEDHQRLFSLDIIPMLPKMTKPGRNVKTLDDPEGDQGTLF